MLIESEGNPRDYCILTLFLNCALRLSELVNLSVSQMKNEYINIVGKGNKERSIFHTPATKKALASWLEVRKSMNPQTDALFITKNGERITSRGVQDIVKKYLKKAGLDGRGISVHKLRHTAATTMFQYGHVDVRTLKALCAGNPLIAEKMGLDVEVAKLKMLKANHQSQQYRLEDNLRLNFPKQIESTKAAIEGYKTDAERLEMNTVKVAEGISPMTISGNSFTERKDAGAALIEACRSIYDASTEKVGSYRGFEVSISFDTHNKEHKCHLKGAMSYAIPLGSDPVGNITRIDNAIEKISATIDNAEAKLETLYSQVENAKAELARPFPQEAELAEKSVRLTELDALLSLDGKDEQATETRDGDTHVVDSNDGREQKTQHQPAPPSASKENFTAVMEKAEGKKNEINTAKPTQDKAKKKSNMEL